MMKTLNDDHGMPAQPAKPEDSDLLAAVGSGDQRAIACLYDRYSKLVYSVAVRVCHDPVLAEEILQDLFMQIWLAPLQFGSGTESISGRLALLTRNRAIKLMRKRKHPESAKEPASSRPFDPISHTEVNLLLQKPHALALLLPDAGRQMLGMAFFDDKTPAEIAEETGLSPGAIARSILNVLRAVRDQPDEVGSLTEDTGLEVLDLDTNSEFNARNLREHDLANQMEGLRRLTHSFVQSPNTILQELVNAALDLCGADSAGISLEMEQKSEKAFYHWVATAGQYNEFLSAILPRYPSACGICLERGKPQLFRVRQRFFDMMGINAPLVTDGILLPWQVGETRGTIFIMAHGRAAAFDKYDGQLMRVMADFAAMAVRQQRRQEALIEQAKVAAAAAMANQLAHQINNPLQSLMNVAYLAAGGHRDTDPRALGRELCIDLQRLSLLVRESLEKAGKVAG